MTGRNRTAGQDTTEVGHYSQELYKGKSLEEVQTLGGIDNFGNTDTTRAVVTDSFVGRSSLRGEKKISWLET
ncbi:unnamed protein product [Allacma fusca]|uniref:Uncharacterized protein n=1 Tax=Allacma fusca TaxID=39272 RepID=A0A8J2KZB6_9HEXA|nr:unnamed protein product [Allacma fusca]